MFRLRVLAALFFLSFALPVSGQEQVTLKPRFVKGWPINQEITTETTQKMKVGGTDVKSVVRDTFYLTCTPLGEDVDGNWVVMQRLDRVNAKIETSGSPPMIYDSANGRATDSPP